MKAVSEAVSTVIIAATVVMVSVTIFYFAILNMQQSVAMAEYGYIKSVMYGLCSNIPNILQGGSYGANTPSRLVGVGYAGLPDTSISIYVEKQNEVLLDYTDEPTALFAIIRHPVVTYNSTLYGVHKYIVNDTILLPRLTEYYYNGATYISFDMARVYIKVYKLETGQTRYIVNIVYLDLAPVLVSTSPSRIVVTISRDIVNAVYQDVDEIKITYTNSTGSYETTLQDLIPDLQPSDIVDVNIVIKELRVVIM